MAFVYLVGVFVVCLFVTGSPYVLQAGLKLTILLQPSEFWDSACTTMTSMI
jgi:hypothetical protein